MPKIDDGGDAVDQHDLVIDTLSGDIRDAMLSHFRNQKRPWSLMVEGEQREVANSFESAAKGLVRQVVRIVTDYDFPRVVVRLGEVKSKGGEKGMEGKFSCEAIEANWNELLPHVGELVVMQMVDSETFMAERAPAPVAPDQGELPTAAE